MSGKDFRIHRDRIRPLAEGRGGCIATDLITVGGHKVGFMDRETPDNDLDSGWRFLSGLESEVFMRDADNHGVYDVNTIANDDPDIISLLDAPIGSAFERDETGRFVEVDDEAPED
jgi:hypothetical protein